MTDICVDMKALSREIKSMLKESDKIAAYEVVLPDGSKATRHAKLNQTAVIDNNKITDTKASVGDYTRHVQGKPVIYTETTPSTEPGSRDVEELISKKRPFICRAVSMFGKEELACYTSNESPLFNFVKDSLESIKESGAKLKGITGKTLLVKVPAGEIMSFESKLAIALRTHQKEFERILNPVHEELERDSYGIWFTTTPGRSGLASSITKKCSLVLR